MGIDSSKLSEHRINWMLLTEPGLSVEAGTASLRLALEDCRKEQQQGNLPVMPIMPEMKDIVAGNWIYSKFDCLLSRNYGPDILMELITRSEVIIHPTITQRFTNCLSFSPAKHLPWLHIVVWESGIFDEIEFDTVIVGVNESNMDYLLEIAQDNDWPYLQRAAQSTLTKLKLTTENKKNVGE